MYVQHNRSLDNGVYQDISSDGCVQQDRGLDSYVFKTIEVKTAVCSTEQKFTQLCVQHERGLDSCMFKRTEA